MTTTILATCGGWMPSDRADVELSPLQRLALDLAGVAGRAPRILYVNTAGGDQRHLESQELVAARLAGVEAQHLRLFGRADARLEDAVRGADVVWVGGGSVVNLLAVWRAHGLDTVLEQAWRAGTVLAGTSAGALCWHAGGPTSSFGPGLDVVGDGLCFVPHSLAVHYDSQPRRRPVYHQAIADGRLPGGYALEEGTAVLYRDGRATEFLTEVPGAAVLRVDRVGSGVEERRLDSRLLPSAA